jgi:hypothetical protein
MEAEAALAGESPLPPPPPPPVVATSEAQAALAEASAMRAHRLGSDSPSSGSDALALKKKVVRDNVIQALKSIIPKMYKQNRFESKDDYKHFFKVVQKLCFHQGQDLPKEELRAFAIQKVESFFDQVPVYRTDGLQPT